MHQIFVSYRRSDSRIATERILDSLRVELGSKIIFKDTDSMPLGRDYREVVRETISHCDVLVVVIGPTWVDVALPDGRRRLTDRDDPVRLELQCAHENGLAIIPILVDGAQLPASNQLPKSLRFVRRFTALQIRHDPDYRNDLDRLVYECRRIVRGTEIPNLPIPTLSGDAHLPVRVLASAAYLFRGIFIQMAEGKSLREIYAERGDYLLQCDKVVETWCSHFGIPEDD